VAAEFGAKIVSRLSASSTSVRKTGEPDEFWFRMRQQTGHRVVSRSGRSSTGKSYRACTAWRQTSTQFAAVGPGLAFYPRWQRPAILTSHEHANRRHEQADCYFLSSSASQAAILLHFSQAETTHQLPCRAGVSSLQQAVYPSTYRWVIGTRRINVAQHGILGCRWEFQQPHDLFCPYLRSLEKSACQAFSPVLGSEIG